MSISFLSCKSATDIKGEYRMSLEELNLPDAEAEMMKQMAGDFKLVLGEDNKLTFTMMGQEVIGSYKQSGNKLELTMKDNTETATIEGDKIMMEAEGQKMIFIKTKKTE